MNYLGEIISLAVAVLWTMAALTCEYAGRRFGVLIVNVWRMLMGVVLSGILCWCILGSVFPLYADVETWAWMLLSGMIGFFLGDMCLLNSYLYIGSQHAQLLMTTAPIFSAFGAWIAMGQSLTVGNMIAMAVTLLGIAIAVLGKAQGKKRVTIDLPIKGMLFGLAAGMGQGFGYLFSVIGLHHYVSIVPAAQQESLGIFLPFSANFIRMIAGLICFTTLLLIRGKGKEMCQSVQDGKGMFITLLAVLSGPLIGVGLSLMASQYTAAGIASTIMAITPIIILPPAYFLFHRKITLKAVIGAIISVVGVSLFFLL